MVQIRDIAETEQILATYVPQVKELLGKDLTLVRMKPMLEKLGNPQNGLKIIHIAGTSGKTSTAYFTASLLQQAGKKVGLTVSPHLDSVTERIQINLVPLEEAEFCSCLGEFLDLISDVDPKPTYFELLIAFVYWYFAKVQVDYAVIETGLGGSFDATNVATNADKVCVITDIGLDHTHVLGKALPEIASQKAGIIHTGNQVFLHSQSPAVMQVFETKASQQNAILNVLSVMKGEDGAVTDSLADYQKRNWSLAKVAFDYITNRDSLPGLTQEQLTESTKIQVPGRMDIVQVLGKTVVMDGAHNEQKMTAFVNSFKKLYPDQKVPIMLSLKQGKEYKSVLPLLKPVCSRLIVTSFKGGQDLPSQPISPETLASEAEKLGFDEVVLVADCMSAYDQLLKTGEDIAIITGSFYLLSNVRRLILKKP